MIQHNLLKAKKFINNSVARVRDVNFSLIREGFSSDNQISKPQPPVWLLFAREILRNPRAMGAGCSSTQQLARMMARFVPLSDPGLVVELGGGTGTVTEALLQHGVAPEHLVSIERAANLANYIRQRCPQVRVIEGDALHLYDLLSREPVSTIVSSLPFRSLPQAVGHRIIKQIDKVLPKNGLMIQFTYDLRGRMIFLPHHFKRVTHQMVWSNFPPARVDVYQSEK